MIIPQMSFSLSPYSDIYDLIIPKNNLLRQIKESVDFSFVYKELIPKYCPNNGQGAIDKGEFFDCKKFSRHISTRFATTVCYIDFGQAQHNF